LTMCVPIISFPAPELWDHVRARHIATSLNDAFCVRRDELGKSTRDQLERLRFDQAPVVGKPEHIVGWVSTDNLEEQSTVQSSMTSLGDSAIVST
jgi:CBS domain containing-hemolysin-like protein